MKGRGVAAARHSSSHLYFIELQKLLFFPSTVLFFMVWYMYVSMHVCVYMCVQYMCL